MRTKVTSTDGDGEVSVLRRLMAGRWNHAKGDAVNVLGEGGPIPSAEALAARVVRDALAVGQRRAA